jgi:hypothetical protein
MQPFVARRARMHGFLFEGKRDALERLCARYLDRSANGGPDYEPLSHFILVTFTQIDGVTAEFDPFKSFGRNSEREVTFWVPVRQRGTLHAAMFTPYCLLDNPLAIQHGREIYGFPKEFARFPQWGDDGFQVEAYAFRHFAPDSVGHIQPVMSVDRTGEPVINLQLPIFDDVLALVRAIRPELDMLPDWLWPPHGPVIFPKQIPDIDDGGLAAYSAIVEAPVTLTGLHHVHHLPGDYTLHLTGVESHPIEQDLGLATGDEAIIDFYADFDFTLGSGRVLWSA